MRLSRSYDNTTALRGLNRVEKSSGTRAERRAHNEELRGELKVQVLSDEQLEVLADWHEQAGRVRLAELMRRG